MKNYIEETKKCLETYEECKIKLVAKEKMLSSLKEARKQRIEGETGVTSIQYDAIAAKTNKVTSRVEEIAIKNAQFELDLEEEIEVLSYYLKRVDIKMEELKPIWKEILKVKYLENNTWRYTAVEVGQSEATCRRYAKDAIVALADKLVGQKSYIDLPLFRDIYVEAALA